MKNIFIKSIYIYILSSLVISHMYAQPVNNHTKNLHVSSPNAAAFNKYVDIPVSHYTGVPNISIPIHTIKEGPLELPISLSFHAGGIRVDDVSSWIGMGWSLNTGGSLSRTVQGIEDEHGDGYFTTGGYQITDDPSYMLAASKGYYDYEPDIFTFTAGNYSGKFIFDKNKVIKMFPFQNVKIIPDASLNIIKIITPEGLIYTFGTKEYNYTDIESSFPNRWMLDKIESADNKYSISFNYQQESFNQEIRGSRFRTYGFVDFTYWQSGQGGGNSSNSCNGVYGNYTSFMNLKTQRLVSITTGSNTSQVQFVPSANAREDLSSKLLSYISISEGTFCKNYFFNHDYTKSISGATQSKQKRLRLLSIQEKSCDNSSEKPPHTFEYESGDASNGLNSDGSFFMPEQLSRSIDHWGYYNEGQNWWQQTLTPRTEIIDHGGNVVIYGEADRAARPIGKKGLLKKIQYSEGGTSTFEYENNDYWGQSETGAELNSVYGPCPNAPNTCCENQVQSLNRTFPTGTNFDEIFIIAYGETRGYCGAPHEYSLKVYNNSTNTYLGAYSFNLPPQNPFNNGENSGERRKKLSEIITPSVGVSYRFEMTLTNMYGYFKLMQFPYGNIYGAGFRVKKITTNDGVSVANDVVTNYEYKGNDPSSPNKSSGKLRIKPKYSKALIYSGHPYVIQASGGNISGNFTQFTTIFYDQSFYPESNLDGVVHGYSYVKEIHSGNGTLTFSFTNEENQIDPNLTLPIFTNIYDDINGKQINKELNSGSIQKESTQYTSINKGTLNGTMIKIVSLGVCQNMSGSGPGSPPAELDGVFPILYQNYSYFHKENVALVSKTTTENNGVTNIIDLTYDTNTRHTMPITVTTTNSDGKVHKTEYMYNHDYDNSTGMRDFLLSKNIISSPFRTTIKVDNVHVDGPETGYSWYNLATGARQTNSTGAFVRPYQVYRYEKTFDANGNILANGGITLQATIDAYDQYGNISQITMPNWQPEFFEWFSHGGLKKYQFQNHIKDYTYHPGTKILATVKEIDGQITYFDYDKLTRLSKTVQRKVGSTENVKTEYTYQYKNASEPRNWINTKTTYTPTTNSDLTTREQKEFFDGLGRPVQSMKFYTTPTPRRVYKTMRYDNRGRLWREYEPTFSSGTSTAFVDGYSGAYTETLYEPSPLHRVSSVKNLLGFTTIYGYGSNTGSEVFNPNTNSNYAASSLNKTIVTDPNNNKTITYMDKRGRQVMSRRTNQNETESANTVQLYDLKDRIATIIPPGATLSNTGLIFQYLYDTEDKVLTKTIPDKGVEKFVYNNRDLVSFTQDAKWTSLNHWIHTKYDDYGRALSSGRYTHSSSAHPDGNTNPAYADQYTETSYFTQLSDGVKLGKINFTKDKILNTSVWLQKNFNYDAFGRVSSVAASNHLYNDMTAESLTNDYDMADNIMRTTRTYKTSASDQQTVINRYTYDEAGRVKNKYITALGGTEIFLSNSAYNDRDELTQLNLGPVAGGSSYLQKVDYTYNTQGWLTNINPEMPVPSSFVQYPVTMPSGIGNGFNDLFHLNLRYDDPDTGAGTPASIQKNGNISQLKYQVIGKEKEYWTYSYDYLDRLKDAAHTKMANSGAAAIGQYTENISFDGPRGNITGITRNGMLVTQSNGVFTNVQAGQIDNLSMLYTPGTNRLQTVTDAGQTGFLHLGFNQLPGTGNLIHQYDASGNMTYDHSKRATIVYNHLNLPASVTFQNGNRIDYTYDASGKKLTTTRSTNGTTVEIQQYLGGIEYKQVGSAYRLEAIYHPEGRLYNTNITNTSLSTISLRNEYCIKDHLGNTRLSFADKNNNGQIDVTTNGSTNEILQENHYYPFGMSMEGAWMNDATANDKPYQYNSKELESFGGLGWYDYGARWYDPTIGKFLGVDPLAGKMPGYSPYSYSFNNPIRFIDPDGRAPMDASSWPPKWWTRWSNRSEAEKSIPLGYSMIAYNMRYEKGSHTVGTIATNFSLMGKDASSNSILTPESKSNTGSQNAVRHATLSALAYSKFFDGGVTATLASHEENTVVDPNQTHFKTYDQVDMAADYKNNQLGKDIADELGGLLGTYESNKSIFEKVIDKAYNEGVWQGVKVKGGYELRQVKLTEKQYCEFKEALQNKDNNAEWKK